MESDQFSRKFTIFARYLHVIHISQHVVLMHQAWHKAVIFYISWQSETFLSVQTHNSLMWKWIDCGKDERRGTTSLFLLINPCFITFPQSTRAPVGHSETVWDESVFNLSNFIVEHQKKVYMSSHDFLLVLFS